MGQHYDRASMPAELRRDYDVYERIDELGIDLGSFEEDVISLEGAGIAKAVVQEGGLVYLSGTIGGDYPMNDDMDRLRHGYEGGQFAADVHIRALHWTLSCGGEGDLNDLLYTVKALGMVVSPGGGAFAGAPQVTNGYSFRWQSVFGGGMGSYASGGIDAGGFAGVHARSAMGGFDGRFSIEPEMIVAIPQSLATEIIGNRGWVYPLPPPMLHKVRLARG